ncbi:MAG: alpha/beta hydrolase [Candidatus Limnocylindria bacterium]|nr:alpha/beta hydrolase [Candidatus Limnocylindria bacterium]
MPKRLPRTRTLKGEVKLAHYDSVTGVAGEPAIVLIHASLFRSEDWENVFPRLGTRYRTVAYDHRGHGKSGRATDYSLRAFAGDAIHVLRDLVKSPAVLIGHSLGALAALAAAAEVPDLVAGLVLEDPPLGYGGPWPAETYTPLRDALVANDPAALRKAVDRFPLASPGPHGERTYGEMRGFYAADRVLTYYKDLDPAFLDWRMKGEDAKPLVAGWLERVAAPTLVIAGEPRLGSTLDDASEWKLKKAIKDLTVKRFPGTGHVIHGYRPEQFLENLEPFLRRIRTT